MRFQVPQFIEIEDKIFGPLTLKQFIYVAGGVGIAVIFFTFLPKFFAFILAAPFVGVSLALAFYKPNNRPFVFALESMINYFFGEKLYVWKKRQNDANTKERNEAIMLEKEKIIPSGEAKLSGSRLRDLAWSLDVMDINQHVDNK